MAKSPSIRSAALFLTACLLVCAGMLSAQVPTVAEQYLLAAINAERTNAGLPPLATDRVLVSAARQHALRMGANGVLSHQLTGEPELLERTSAAGTFYPLVTENIGEGQSSIDLHQALMQSPHHRENIMDSEVNSVGIAAVPYRGELWVVEDFAYKAQPLSYADQEEQVVGLLQGSGLQAVQTTARARTMCQMKSGFVGPRPAFVMRYIGTGLSRLPSEVNARILQGGVSQAEVGACAPDRTDDFSVYNIAIVLYR